MKQLLFAIFLLVLVPLQAQEIKPYGRTFGTLGFGITKVQDVKSFVPLNTELGALHMLNTKFGAQASLGFTRLYDDFTFETPEEPPINFVSVSLQGVANMGRVLDFEEFVPWYTILIGVGGTYIYTEEQLLLNHRYSTWHISSSINNVFDVLPEFSLNLKLDIITGVNNRPFVPDTETTNIFNINLGVIVNLTSKKDKATFYVSKQKVDTIFLKPSIIDKTKTVRQVYTLTSKADEYVFFDHDSYIVNRSGLNAIKKASNKLTSKNKIHVTGYSSPPGATEYNLLLSKKRVEAVVSKLISIGIEESQIVIDYKGEIDTEDSKNIDLSRYVILSVL